MERVERENNAVANDDDLDHVELNGDKSDGDEPDRFNRDQFESEGIGGESQEHRACIAPTIVYKEATTQTDSNIPVNFQIPDYIRDALEREIREWNS